MNRGITYEALKRYDDAIADYTHVIEVERNLDVYAYYQVDGDATQVLADTELMSIAYSNRGLTYSAMAQYDSALADYSQAIELDPTSASVYIWRARTYNTLRDYEAAIADYSTAIELDPTSASAYNSRAYGYFEKGNLDQALIDVGIAIQLKPESPSYYDSRCEFYLKSREWALGLADCQHAVSLDWTFSPMMSQLIDEANHNLQADPFSVQP